MQIIVLWALGNHFQKVNLKKITTREQYPEEMRQTNADEGKMRSMEHKKAGGDTCGTLNRGDNRSMGLGTL